MPAEVGGVLGHFGVDAISVELIPTGRFNTNWAVDSRDAQYVLRRYNAARLAASIPYEHAMLAHVSAAGWPVATAIASTDGKTVIEHDGRRCALFPFLEGEAGPAHNPRHLRIKGRLLARLHRDMTSFPAAEQRAGFGRVWELDVPLEASRFGTFNAMLRECGRNRPELASAIRTQRYRSLRELARLAYGDLPDVHIHGDFQRDNLLFDRGELTGVLDFDHAHRDARVADIAWSILSDCAEPPAETAIDPRLAAALVGGYAEHTPLADAELHLIVPMIRGHNLSILAWTLRRWLDAPDAEMLRRLERRVSIRLPQLDARAAAIDEAIAGAVRRTD